MAAPEAMGRSTQKKGKAQRHGRAFSRRAIRSLTILLLIFSVYLLYALFRIQVLEHSSITRQAADQYYANLIEQPKRGSILDRNGTEIAGTSFVYRIGITPRNFARSDRDLSQDDFQNDFANLLGIKMDDLLKAMDAKDSQYELLAKDISEEVGKEIESYIDEHGVSGVRLDKEPKRFYTNGKLASQVLGFAGTVDGQLRGRRGIELACDDLLRGQAGFSYAARDNYLSNGRLPFSTRLEQARSDGDQISLTLDMGIQEIIQKDLEAAVKAYDARNNGVAIVMNPYNGEIYAMASYPYYRSDDPLAPPSGYDEKSWKALKEEEQQKILNLAWTDQTTATLYEAGSTFKALTAAIGMEENVTSEETTYSDAPIQVLDATISCWTGDGHGYETMEQGFINSCNPVFVQVALNVGIDTYYRYMHDFGFYEPTGLGLPDEAACIFHAQPSVLDLANLSFGESSSVTPMHLMRAYAALVNGGKLITPQIIKEVRSADGQLIQSASPQVERQVISARTSLRVRNLMSAMVKDTDSRYSLSWGYNIGGKTSTSTDELTDQVTTSFMAAAPIDHPQFLCLMVISQPANSEVGGAQMEMVTQNTVSRILEYLNVERNYNDVESYKLGQSIRMPNLYGYSVTDAAQMLDSSFINVVAGDELTQGSSTIRSQSPAPDTLIYPGTSVYVYAGDFSPPVVSVPDLSNMNYNEVLAICNPLGLVPQFEGNFSGLCVAQKVDANSKLPEGSQGEIGEAVYFGTILKVGME